MEEIKLHSF